MNTYIKARNSFIVIVQRAISIAHFLSYCVLPVYIVWHASNVTKQSYMPRFHSSIQDDEVLDAMARATSMF